ncbi:MAG TPA: hypothetical protein VG537_00630 [Candidatus Kapabacteria bacterium]|nr:hypothetical protein [Candidatus Kapabacteria bacterium]
MKRLPILLLLSTLPFLASMNGCSSSTSTTTQNYVIVQGNVYNYATTDSSSSGATHRSTSDSVTNADTTYKGKTHCYEVRADSISFYHAESNGDVSYYFPSLATIDSIGAAWITLPFSSKTSAAIVQTGSGTVNTTLSGVPLSIPVTDTITVGYVGTDTLTVNGKLLNLSVVKVTILYTATTPLGSGTVTFTEDYAYSSDIAFFGKKDFKLVSTGAAASLVTSRSSADVLTSYTIH